MGKEYVAEGLVEAFAGHRPGRQARAAAARRRGARPGARWRCARAAPRVDVVEAYRTVVPEDLPLLPSPSVSAQRPDCVTFTSSSTVRNLVEAAGIEALRGIPAVSIGPITTRTAQELGLTVTAQAEVFTVEGLLQAVLGLYA